MSPPQDGHLVPEQAAVRTARTLAATPGVRGEPSDAERARTLLAGATHGTLATLAREPGGFPFGSLAGYADDGGRPLLCLSDLAEHSRNLAADARASLLVQAPPDPEAVSDDPLATARVTLLGTVAVLDGAERAAALPRYRAAHPGAFYAEFGDFHLYRLDVAAVRYVGGFGRMSWVDTASYAGAEPDPLRPHAERVIAHMNDDHPDALVAYCRVFGGRPDTLDARMVAVDRYGFAVLAADAPDSAPVAVRIPFGRRVDTVGGVRTAMIELLHEARATR